MVGVWAQSRWGTSDDAVGSVDLSGSPTAAELLGRVEARLATGGSLEGRAVRWAVRLVEAEMTQSLRAYCNAMDGVVNYVNRTFSLFNTATPKAGLGFELDVIAACFIGGASASGGVGRVRLQIPGESNRHVGVTLTGMSRETARFQARSALSGTGFTTTEEPAPRVPDERINPSFVALGAAVKSLYAGLDGLSHKGKLWAVYHCRGPPDFYSFLFCEIYQFFAFPIGIGQWFFTPDILFC